MSCGNQRVFGLLKTTGVARAPTVNINTIVHPDTIPGFAWGITILQCVLKEEEPKSFAASIWLMSKLSMALYRGNIINKMYAYTRPVYNPISYVMNKILWSITPIPVKDPELIILNKNSSLKIKNVGLNPTRIGFYELLKKHGAKIHFNNKRKKNNEVVGDINIKSGKLKKPIISSKDFYEKTTDEFPILFCIAALTKGTSIFKGIEDLANKESNRIKEMQKVLKQIGVKSSSTKNDLKIFGKGIIDASKKNINIPNLGDHRICMSSFILATITGARIKINNFETVYTSSPSFLKTMRLLGAKFEIR